MDIIDEQEVGLPVTFSKFDQRIVLDCIDKLVREFLARKIHYLEILLPIHHLLTDRLHQMGLSQADPTINEQRIIGFRRGLRDCERSSVRELVVRANDKSLKAVARI